MESGELREVTNWTLRRVPRSAGLSPVVMPLHPDLSWAMKEGQEEPEEIAFTANAFTENLLYVCVNTFQPYWCDYLHFTDEI